MYLKYSVKFLEKMTETMLRVCADEIKEKDIDFIFVQHMYCFGIELLLEDVSIHREISL